MSDLDLAGAVRWLQANKVPDKNGLQWDQWLGKNATGKLGVLRDPARHKPETLRGFLEDVSGGLPELVLSSAEKRDKALQQLEDALGTSPKEQTLLRLLKLTRDHQSFRSSYACLCYHASQAVRLKRKAVTIADVEDLLLAVDCEMVATEDDDNALARVCACDAAGKVLMDRLVKPEGKITDARTAITGIESKDLDNLDFHLSDAQAELRKLIGPNTVLVGHTFHRDLSALRMDALLVFDISLLYGIQGQPKRRPALAHLVQEVLGRPNFRGADGGDVHDCVQDVQVTMEIALRRLRDGSEQGAPATVFVTAPTPSAQVEETMRKLYIHRIPQRDDAFGALTRLWAALPVEVSGAMEGVQMMSSAMVNAGLRGAEVLFKTKEAAEKAFLSLPAENIELDTAQRPQKLVRIHFPERTALVCVRPMVPGIGMACLSNGTDDAPAVAAGTEQSKRKRPDMSTAENAKRWKGKGWPGWRRAAEEALAGAPSRALPWRQLAEEMVQRRQQQGGGNAKEAAETAEVLELLALAALPEEFLSDSDALVRLQK
ncbi:unnamed protein product [Cladocopium goreaui]|uniref:Small RNA degrading nuclease 1 n=1 Tax=Cladocopium goreaui TaxID=2562237 RepID=A0A9P1DTI8_9DINO|nr:unnamed protein product [Cladocopium goreaui]